MSMKLNKISTVAKVNGPFYLMKSRKYLNTREKIANILFENKPKIWSSKYSAYKVNHYQTHIRIAINVKTCLKKSSAHPGVVMVAHVKVSQRCLAQGGAGLQVEQAGRVEPTGRQIYTLSPLRRERGRRERERGRGRRESKGERER